mgnify:CR=1 FL=1
MPRTGLSAQDRENRNNLVPWALRQWQPVHGAVATDGAFTPADASMRAIAIPPIRFSGTNQTTGPFTQPPDAVQLYRDDEYYINMDTLAASNFGAWLPGGAAWTILLDPSQRTIFYAAALNTGPLRGLWVFGS